MISKVTALVSKKKLEFTPDTSFEDYNPGINSENKFEVEVINNSNKFTSLQLELSTPGVDQSSQNKWYVITPEVCAKKPPGSKTQFQVVITKAPIPAYETTIDLFLKVFSVEDENLSTVQKLSLKINKPLKPLRVEMLTKEFKVSPEDEIEIPVLVYNLSPKFSQVTLTCSGLDPGWMTQGNQNQLNIEPGEVSKTIFLCKPPKLTLSRKYDFKIEVTSNTTQYSPDTDGVLEVIPDGVVTFSCDEMEKTIPKKGVKSSESATYKLEFWNASNLAHKVDIVVPEKDEKICNLKIPEPIKIIPKETKKMHLLAAVKRHYLGRVKIHKITVSPLLSNPITGKFREDIAPKPSTQIFTLKILPIIPFWAQIGGIILVPLLILLNMLSHKPKYHEGPVNSVRFFGNGSLVFSGSSDQTIRRWQVKNRFLGTKVHLQHEGKIAEQSELKKAVRVIRQSPKDNGPLAIGLENGEIKLWDISTNKPPDDEKYEKSLNLDKANRVFDLVFTKNARSDSLFSAHGNGLVNQWDIETSELTKSRRFDFAISALAIYETDTNKDDINRTSININEIDDIEGDRPLIFIAGRFNKMVVWEPKSNLVIPIQYNYSQNTGQNENSFAPVVGQQHYITSLAANDKVLASADNRGYITLWNLEEIRQCVITNILKKRDKQENKDIHSKSEKIINNTENENCSINNIKYIERWNHGQNQEPIRSVALTKNGKSLASTGDDGRIIIWKLKELKYLKEGEGIRKCKKGIKIANFPDTKFNSIDIKQLSDEKGNYLLIASGDDEQQVKLYRHRQGVENNANCQ